MKLTKRNYFIPKANREYMSVSQFKAFEDCEERALAEINGKYVRPDTTALLVGSYVDAFFEGSMRAFTNRHPEIFKRDGSLKAEYVQAQAIIARIGRDRLFTEYLNGQKQVIMEGEIAGVKVKVKIDVLHEDKIVDLKIMRDMESIYVEDYGRLPFFEAWKYDLQGAVYQEIVRQNTGKTLPFYLAVATKEEIPDLDIIHLEDSMLSHQLEHFADNVIRYDAIKAGIIEPCRCGKCRYCRESKVLTAPTSSDEFYLL